MVLCCIFVIFFLVKLIILYILTLKRLKFFWRFFFIDYCYSKYFLLFDYVDDVIVLYNGL